MRHIVLEPNSTGCTNRCRHCCVEGAPPFGELMTLEQLRWVVDEFERLLQAFSPRRAIGIRLDVPFEPTAHPRFLDLYEYLMAKCMDSESRLSCLNTNGWGIVRWKDWREVLGKVKQMGVTSVGSAVHGLAEEHDWFCRRSGAFADLMEASRRVLASGLELTLEIHLNKRNLPQMRPLIEKLRQCTDDRAKVIWSISTYYMNDRLRALEALRPTEEDLAPLLDDLLAVYKRELPWTESAWVAWLRNPESDLGELYEAYEPAIRMRGGFGSDPGERSFGVFRVTPSFDVVEKFCSRPDLHHGNLKGDGSDVVWERIVDAKLSDMAKPAELAERFGDANSQRRHEGASVYLKCCDAYWHSAGVSPG